ncbi:MAG: TolC family protein [Acidobacteriota bacterium]
MISRSTRILTLSLYALGFGLAQTTLTPSAAPQVPRQTTAPVPSTSLSGMMPQGPFGGGLPQGQPAPGSLPLSLSDAIARGLKRNLGLYLSEQGTRTAQAQRLYALSGLLPNVAANVSETGEQINLKALGFSVSAFPGIRPVVGPFNIFDARLGASQPVLNFQAIRNLRAGNENLRAAQLSARDARDIVVLVVAGLYLQAVAGQARIEAVQAQVNTAQTLYQTAADQKKAGVVPGIDVLRAQVELQAQQQRLIFYQNEFEKQKLALARAIGLPLAQQFTLADKVGYTPPPAFGLDQALEQAYKDRADYRSASALVAAAEHSKSAAEAGRLPSLQFDGNYGAIGPRPWDSHGTFTAALGLNIPIFRAGRTRADILEADAQLQQRRAQLDDLRNSIEQDVRTAFLDLKASGDQVAVARSAVDLAGQQLKQSQDRFSAGVTNNVEVVQSQEAVATANDNYISALFSYNLAKATLARALGGAETTYLQFLGGGH